MSLTFISAPNGSSTHSITNPIRISTPAASVAAPLDDSHNMAPDATSVPLATALDQRSFSSASASVSP